MKLLVRCNVKVYDIMGLKMYAILVDNIDIIFGCICIFLTFWQEYASISTVAGLHFIFEPKFNQWQKCVWAIVLFMLVILSLYWSVWIYVDWRLNPVQTTVVTAALDIRKIPFPSVTICQNGFMQGAIQKTIWYLYDSF